MTSEYAVFSSSLGSTVDTYFCQCTVALSPEEYEKIWIFLEVVFRICSRFFVMLGSTADTFLRQSSCRSRRLRSTRKLVFFWETSSGFIPTFSALCFDSGYMSAVFEAGFAGNTALHAVFSSLVGKPRMLVILAGMDQEDSLLFYGSGMCKEGIARYDAPRAVFSSWFADP